MNPLPTISLPAAICLTWAAILVMTAFRAKSFRQALALMIAIGVYFLAENTTLLRETAAICIAPLAVLLMLRLRNGRAPLLIQITWLIIPAAFVLLQYFLYIELYPIMLYATGAALAVFLLIYQAKADGKKRNRSGIIVGWLTLALLVLLSLKWPGASWAMCPLLLILGFFLLFSTDEPLGWKDLGAVMRYNAAPEAASVVEEQEEEPKVEAAPEAEEEPEVAETPVMSVPLLEDGDENSLLSRFQHLLLEERIFLQPGITLTEVAEKLHSNKTYVSKMVNENYKVGFPELINTLRIDYAEEYILSHRDARQEEIARECGFLSASTFNNTFKIITGMPPKQWVTNWDALHK